MNRRTRHLVVLAVAVLTASIASFGVYRAMERMPARPGETPHRPVVVAARSLPIGTELTEQDVKVVDWPSASLVPGAIGAVSDVVNRGLVVAILQNEPITVTKLSSKETGAGLSPAIPPGMRAISVKVDDVIGVSGFVAPGSRVDLVVTIRREADSMTRTVASNVQVLTAGTRREQGNPELDTKASPTSVVTLIVSPEDAERIALAQSEGQIMLVLRNPLDEEPTVTSGVKTAALMGTDAPAPAPVVKTAAPRRAAVTPPPPAEPEPPVVRVRTVEAIRAAKRTEEEIK